MSQEISPTYYHLLIEPMTSLLQSVGSSKVERMVFNIFSKKDKQDKEKMEEKKEQKEKEGEKENKEAGKEILAFSVNSKEALKEALDEFKRGTPTLIGIGGVREQGMTKTKELVEELLSFTKKTKGRILGIGDNYLFLSPEEYDLRVKDF